MRYSRGLREFERRGVGLVGLAEADHVDGDRAVVLRKR